MSPANSAKNQKPKKPSLEGFPGSIFLWIFLFLSIFYFTRIGSMPTDKQLKQLSTGEFYTLLEANDRNPVLKSGVRILNDLTGTLVSGENYTVTLPNGDPDLERLLRKNLPSYDIRPERT